MRKQLTNTSKGSPNSNNERWFTTATTTTSYKKQQKTQNEKKRNISKLERQTSGAKECHKQSSLKSNLYTTQIYSSFPKWKYNYKINYVFLVWNVDLILEIDYSNICMQVF